MTMPHRYPASEAANRRAYGVMPGGNTRSTVFEAPFPIYVARGVGAYVHDLDGNVFLDLQNNFTALIHGHCHEPTADALRRQVGLGTCFGNPTLSEIALAELLCERVPHFEQVRFTNTGSEAVMMAVKAARALTGRPKIAKCEGAYHGNYDVVEVSLDPTPESWGDNRPRAVAYNRGTPDSVLGDAVIIPFNDPAMTEEILNEQLSSLAAVIIDPMPSRMGLIPASPEYLKFLRHFTKRHGLLLIADEVLNFRMGYRGAMSVFGVEPDLTSFGKIIGGGLPVGAIAGRSEVMAVFDPRKGKPAVSHAGTFTANPMTMSAGIAAMQHMTQDAFAQLNSLGDYARRGLAEILEQSGIAGQVTGMGSLFLLHLRTGTLSHYRDVYLDQGRRRRMTELVRSLRQRGVLLSATGLGALSTAMGRIDVDRLIAALRDSIRELAAAGEMSG
jgi:glutamate-1-semialdehyde 2,1-aminomutase